MTLFFDSRSLALAAALGSGALILGALTFQVLGYAPCRMCHWQRWPHYAAIGIGAAFLIAPMAWMLFLGALSALTTAAIGLFHAGVEQGWWPGPSSCTGGGGLAGLSGSDLLSTDVIDRVVMCDEISWQFLGLSMPAWNALLSLALCVLWVLAFRRRAAATA